MGSETDPVIAGDASEAIAPTSGIVGASADGWVMSLARSFEDVSTIDIDVLVEAGDPGTIGVLVVAVAELDGTLEFVREAQESVGGESASLGCIFGVISVTDSTTDSSIFTLCCESSATAGISVGGLIGEAGGVR